MDPVRQRVHEMFAAVRGVDDCLARKLERCVYNWAVRGFRAELLVPVWDNPAFRFRYTTKALSLKFNLRNPKNPGLGERFASGELTPKQLVHASPEKMWPEFWEPLRESIARIALRKQLTIDVESCPDGAFTCRRCKSLKTTYYQMQTRSADEPSTTFVSCLSCGNRWKC